MEENVVEEIVKERIKNSNIFNDNEQDIILKDISLYAKIYMLGIVDSKVDEI